MMKRGLGISIVLLSVFCLLSFAGCGGDNKRTEDKRATVSGTAWVTHLQDLPQYREYAGTVNSQGNSVVGSQLTEKIQAVFVRENFYLKSRMVLSLPAKLSKSPIKSSTAELIAEFFTIAAYISGERVAAPIPHFQSSKTC